MYKKKIFSGCVLSVILFLSLNNSVFSINRTGDINSDGSIDSSDCALMKRHLLNITPIQNHDSWLVIADTNNDQNVDSTDFALLKRYVLGIINKFPRQTVSPTPTYETSPSTPQPTPSPTSSLSTSGPITNTGAYPDWDKPRKSYATFTGSGYTGGASLLDPIPKDMEITALNPTDYNCYDIKAALAGAYLKVTGSKGSTIVYVNDLYPEGAPGALDLCPISFDKIGEMAAGKIDIQWQIVPAPVKGNVSYRIKEGTTPSWFAIQVRNHKYPVLKMEYYHNGTWNNMPKMLWNHFVGEGLDTTTPTIRITDIRGYVLTDIIDSIPGFNQAKGEAYIVEGNVQFPD